MRVNALGPNQPNPTHTLDPHLKKDLSSLIHQAQKLQSVIQDEREKLDYVVVSFIEEPDFEVVSGDELLGSDHDAGMITSLFSRIYSQNSKDSLNLRDIDIQVIEDLDVDCYTKYQNNVVVSFFSDGIWNLDELKSQLEKDLTRSYVKVNGKILTSFTNLCTEVGIAEEFFYGEKIDSLISSQQRKILYFMSMLQQGAVAEALKYTYDDLPKALEGLILSHYSGDRKLTEITKSIIDTSKNKPHLAFQLCQKECLDHPNLASYLASAVSLGLLSEKIFPRWRTIKNPHPIYPTRCSGICEPGSPIKLTINQDMQLAQIEGDKIKFHPFYIKIEVEVGKKAVVTWKAF